MTIRAPLLVLVLAILLPVLALGVFASGFVAPHEQERLRKGASGRFRALMPASDAEARRRVIALKGVAASNALHTGTVRGIFLRTARLIGADATRNPIHPCALVKTLRAFGSAAREGP